MSSDSARLTTYQQQRSLIRDGDVLAFRGKSFFSKLIRIRTLARVTHVGLALWVRDRLCVLEAREWHGVRMFPLSRYLADGEEVEWHQLESRQVPDKSRRAVVESGLSHWGERYASPYQFLRSWGWLTKWVANRRGLPVDTNRNRLFCSELVAEALLAGGIMPRAAKAGTITPAKTSPGDVVEWTCLRNRGRL